MAKLGEGDARWKVEERADGANVRGWHWSEKNLTAWSREQLDELLCGCNAMEEGSSKGWCKTLSIETMTGDVTLQARKQKQFPLYELEIVLKWEGQLWDEAGKVVTEASGKVKIPDLSEETYDDLDMVVTLDDEADAKRPLKEAMRVQGAKRIREQCMAFVKRLKDSIGQGNAAAMTAKKAAPSERANSTYVSSTPAATKTGELTITYSFALPPHVLYDSLLDTNRIRGATASDASMSREVGGKFTMFSGSVEGTNAALEPFDSAKGAASIGWKWRFDTWQPGHFSDVTITMVEKDGGTALTLTQVGVPEEEVQRTERGWKNMLFDRLKAMLGGSVML